MPGTLKCVDTMNRTKYKREDVQKAVDESISYSGVTEKLFLKSRYRGNQSHIKKVIEFYGIDTSHFLGQGHNKNKVFGPKRPIDDYLDIDTYYINSHSLKKRLIQEKYFEEKCNKCGITHWFGEKVPLELHHINCNNKDNRLENLDILCPNCHAYEHRKINKLKNKDKRNTNKLKLDVKKHRQNQCLKCGVPTSNLRYCSYDCSRSTTLIDWPSTEQVLQMVKDTNFLQTGKKLGVTDNAVRKFLVRNGVNLKELK